VTDNKEIKGVNPLAFANLIAYVFLLVIIGYIFLILPILLLLLGLLYPLAGIACSGGLLHRRKWSWYMAMIMWMSEGVVCAWVGYLNRGFLNVYPQSVLTFVLIAVLRFACVPYLAGRRVREGFHIKGGLLKVL
jgi:hypothetical protein